MVKYFLLCVLVMLNNIWHDILFMLYICTQIDVEALLIKINYWLNNTLSHHDIKVCWQQEWQGKMVTYAKDRLCLTLWPIKDPCRLSNVNYTIIHWWVQPGYKVTMPKDLWVNDIMMIVLAYIWLCCI